MFCYNCGNRVESTSECPFCHRTLPPLNRALEEIALRNLRDDEGAFVPGELPIYEVHCFVKRRTLFGLFGLFRFILELVGDDSDSDFDIGDVVLPPTFSKRDFWQATFSIVTIHRNKIILKQLKKHWIFPMFYRNYGRKEKIILIKDLKSVVQKKENLFALQFDGQEFLIPTSAEFGPEGLVNNLKIANPQIRFTGMTTQH